MEKAGRRLGSRNLPAPAFPSLPGGARGAGRALATGLTSLSGWQVYSRQPAHSGWGSPGGQCCLRGSLSQPGSCPTLPGARQNYWSETKPDDSEPQPQCPRSGGKSSVLNSEARLLLPALPPTQMAHLALAVTAASGHKEALLNSASQLNISTFFITSPWRTP